MTDIAHDRHRLTASDGHEIHAQTWRPAGDARAVVQLLHGLGEHANRYARFAAACVEQGLAVVTHDHRGHGDRCSQYGYFAAKNGWSKVISDALVVQDDIRAKYPDRPVILLGHSMGSYIAQAFTIEYSTPLAGLLLSGSTWPSVALIWPATIIAYIESWRVGRNGYSALLDKIAFGNFNKPFEPARTPMDWLSRDEHEVDKYVEDELCGGPYTCGLWLDLFGGLRDISNEAALRRIPADLPILITGGADDPVGGDKGMGKLAFHYAQTGHMRLKVRIYPDGRHEMLNETNRDEVTADLIEWIIMCVTRSR